MKSKKKFSSNKILSIKENPAFQVPGPILGIVSKHF